MQILLSSISPGANPRKYFDPASMLELEDSIRANGLLQSILVRPVGEGRYEIVAGERRWRACKAVYGEAGAIEADVREMSDQEARVAALVENAQREDMSAAEESRAARDLVVELDGSREAAAAQLGWSLAKLSRRLALLEATPAVLDALTERRISLGHAELLAAAPKDKQDKVLERIIAGNVSVAVLKSQLASISQDLSRALFDKAECGACPHNSSLQAAMFGEAVAQGHCTNSACFSAKTEGHLSILVDELRESVPRVEVLRAGSTLSPIPLVAEGRLGVGVEQAGACRACANFGCAVSALPGSEGLVERDQCFDPACNSEKVASHLRAVTHRADKDGKPGRPAAKPSGSNKASVSATPVKLKEYRLETWKRVLSKEVAKTPVIAAAILLALASSGNARHISAHRMPSRLASTPGEAARVALALSGAELSARLMEVPASAVQDLAERDVVGLLDALQVDLAHHWRIDEVFLGLLTKSEIEALAEEIGLKAAVDEKTYRKAITGKKAEVIAALLKIDGFDFVGKIPAAMQPKSKAGKQALDTPAATQANAEEDAEACESEACCA